MRGETRTERGVVVLLALRLGGAGGAEVLREEIPVGLLLEFRRGVGGGEQGPTVRGDLEGGLQGGQSGVLLPGGESESYSRARIDRHGAADAMWSSGCCQLVLVPGKNQTTAAAQWYSVLSPRTLVLLPERLDHGPRTISTDRGSHAESYVLRGIRASDTRLIRIALGISHTE